MLDDLGDELCTGRAEPPMPISGCVVLKSPRPDNLEEILGSASFLRYEGIAKIYVIKKVPPLIRFLSNSYFFDVEV